MFEGLILLGSACTYDKKHREQGKTPCNYPRLPSLKTRLNFLDLNRFQRSALLDFGPV